MTESRFSIADLVRPEVRELAAYEPVEPPDVLARRLGVPEDRIVKLDANENPYGPSPRVLEALAGYGAYHVYPDPEQRRLRQALAEYAGVSPDQVVAGHGSDELIDMLVRVAVEPGDGVIECPPTFGMYRFLTRLAGGKVIEVERREDFTLDLHAIQRRAREAKIIFLPSPNNPTGNALSQDELRALLGLGMLVVIDEAYVEFGGESASGLVAQHENLIVLRTFSKWAGLAGLRAGYGIMAPDLARILMHVKQPYTPNAAAEVGMIASLEDRKALMERVAALVEERERMRSKLAALEFVKVYPSDANFLLCRLDGIDGGEAHRTLAKEGVFVRYFDTPRLRDCLRISVGLPEHTDRLVEGLASLGGARG